jgi:catechol 2,3-dioxygenase
MQTVPFQITRLGHVVLLCTDLERSTQFYTEVLGFKISDTYPDELMPGRMVFLRCGTDHHTLALIGGASERMRGLHHFAFEAGSMEDIFRARDWLRGHDVPITFEGRRRAGCQIAVEFVDPDGNNVEIYWGVDQIGSLGEVRPAAEWRQAMSLEDAIANPVPNQYLPPARLPH